MALIQDLSLHEHERAPKRVRNEDHYTSEALLSRRARTQYEYCRQDFVGQDTCCDLSPPPQEYCEPSPAYLYHDLSQLPAHCEPSPLPAHHEPPLVSFQDPQKRDASSDALELRLIGVKSGYLNFNSYKSYTFWQKARNERHKEKESKDKTKSQEDREKNVLHGRCPSVCGAKVSILWQENDGSVSLSKVSCNCQEGAWDDYAPSQQKYNGFTETWILSTLFVPAEYPVNNSKDEQDNLFPSIPLASSSKPNCLPPLGLISVTNLENDDGSSLPYVPFNLPRELPKVPTESEQTAVATKATKEDIKYMFPRETTLSTWVCPDDLETVL